MKDHHKYEVIKDLVDHHDNKHSAVITLTCSFRSINRYITDFKKEVNNSLDSCNYIV